MATGNEKKVANPAPEMTTVYQVMIGAAGNKGRGQKKMAGIVHSQKVGQHFIDGLPESVRAHCSVVPLKICRSVQELKEFVQEQAMKRLKLKERILLGYADENMGEVADDSE